MNALSRMRCVAFGVLQAAAAARGAVIYVSPNGNDGHDGAGPDPAHALRTIQEGVNRLRPGDTLRVRGGVYRETVVFPRSGRADAPITVEPYREEIVTISGCEPLSGWTLHDPEKNIWKARMPWTLGKGRNQLFENGEVMIEARFPNEPSPGLGMYVSGLSPLWPTFGEFSIPDPKQPGRIVSPLLSGQPSDYWKGALYYGVHYEGWCAQTGVIESSRSGEILVGDRTRTWWFSGGRYRPEEGRGMIVGHIHALDRPGEWCRQDDTVYLIPKHAGPPRNVEAKRRHVAFDLSGRQYIRISRFRVRGASMRLDGSAFCTVDRCDLAYISHFIRQYSIGQVEHGRDTIRSGETGIYVSGHDSAFLNCSIRYSAGAGFYLRGYHHTIHNCLIDEVDYTSHYLNAVTDAVADFNEFENVLVGGHVITFNTMRNAGRHFFNFYGNGTSRQSRDRGPMDYMGTLFAHNHLYNGMLQTKDAGFLTGYYSSGGTLNSLNSQVAYNVMHDSFDIFAMRIHKLGIVYLDAGTCDVDLHDNLLWAAPGTLQRGMWFNTCCVDIHEYRNVFHPNFTRTCGELRPGDFPGGRPFRFGHDFAHPPPVPAWPPLERRVLEAENSGALSHGLAKSADTVTGVCDGAWLALGTVDFDRGWQSAVMRFAGEAKGMNTDRLARRPPRHRHATDPLVLEAVVNDGKSPGVRKRWTFVHHVLDGAWLRFDGVPLGAGYRRFRVVYGNVYSGRRRVEVHLDSVDGPLVARVALDRTDRDRGGSVQIYAEAVAPVHEAARGTHTVYLVFRSEDGYPVGEFEYFRFELSRADLPLQKNEARFELRLDRPDGDRIGVLYPRYTGGRNTFREFVTRLEGVRGRRVLYLKVRAAVRGPLGCLDAVRLERAVGNVSRIAGLGVPPLRDAAGEMILPKPTNIPCARPADKYPERPTPALRTGPRPLFPVVRLNGRIVIDGRLADWPDSPVMRLAESWDGSPSTAPPSTARIGYDDDAIYIVLSNPVSNPRTLKVAGHIWGRTDAMEIAIQDGLRSNPGPILNLYGWPDGHMVSTREAGAPKEAAERLARAVTYRAAVGPDRWTCEWRIPFSACGFNSKTAPLLLFNLGVRKTAHNAWVIWRGTGGPTWRVAAGGVLVFPAEFQATWKLPDKSLALWLDASDRDSVVTDHAGRVRRWKDKSGAGRDAVQVRPESRPWFTREGLAGKPALEFRDPLRTWLDVPDLSAERTDATVFVVFSNPKPAKMPYPRLFTAGDGAAEYDYKTGLCAAIPGTETGGPRQGMWIFRAGWARCVRIGCFSPEYHTFFNGYISEILVYSRVLAEVEQERIRAHLMLKWGLGAE